jgi:hypothetical protein
VHSGNAQIRVEYGVPHVDAPQEEEDGGFPIVGGYVWMILYDLGRMQVENGLSPLTIVFGRRQTYSPFVPPPLCVLNQEENTTDSEDIGVEKKNDETSEREGEVNVSSLREVVVLWNQNPSH